MSATRCSAAFVACSSSTQVEGQGQHVDGLGVALDAAVGVDVGLVEGGLDVEVELREAVRRRRACRARRRPSAVSSVL